MIVSLLFFDCKNTTMPRNLFAQKKNNPSASLGLTDGLLYKYNCLYNTLNHQSYNPNTQLIENLVRHYQNQPQILLNKHQIVDTHLFLCTTSVATQKSFEGSSLCGSFWAINKTISPALK